MGLWLFSHTVQVMDLFQTYIQLSRLINFFILFDLHKWVKWIMMQWVVWLIDGWNLQSHSLMPLGSNPVQPIRCCLAKGGRLWVGYWNKIYVVDTESKKVEVRNRGNDTYYCLLCLILTISLTHSLYSLSYFTANILSLWAQWTAGSLSVRWWKWGLDFLPTGPNPQAVWLVHRTATTGSWLCSFGH